MAKISIGTDEDLVTAARDAEPREGSASFRFERAVAQAKAAAAGMSAAELTDLIDEAVQWARDAESEAFAKREAADDR